MSDYLSYTKLMFRSLNADRCVTRNHNTLGRGRIKAEQKTPQGRALRTALCFLPQALFIWGLPLLVGALLV